MRPLFDFYKKISRPKYNLGFIDPNQISFDREASIYDIQWINGNGFDVTGWYADPFILDVSKDRVVLLAEKMDYTSNLGKIVWLEVDRNSNSIICEQVALELSTHLSFPYIYRYDDRVFVMPENYHSGNLKLYELDIKNKKLVNPITIIKEPLIDAQLFQHNNKFYILGCRYSLDYSSTKEVEVYEAMNLFGEYSYKQHLYSSYKDKRGAGAIFITDSTRIIRPTQKCEFSYGESVFFNTIKETNGKFQEERTGELKPHFLSRYPIQLHTFNMYKGLVVIDGCGSGIFLLSFLFNIISMFKKNIVKLMSKL